MAPGLRSVAATLALLVVASRCACGTSGRRVLHGDSAALGSAPPLPGVCPNSRRCASTATPANLASGYSVFVNKNENRGTWEGWGCSLSWWGKGVGSSAYESLYADLFFTQQTVRFMDQDLPGLGLTIVRYNVGGGGQPNDAVPYGNNQIAKDNVPRVMLDQWRMDIDGYWKDWHSEDPTNASAWDWFRDSNQRNMMWAARERGVSNFEFFANAPMWWMTDEKSSAGGALQRWDRRAFAKYLATVVRWAQDRWEITVGSVEPFNEPSAAWWNYPIRQEGCNVPREVQKEVLGYLREELDAQGLAGVAITASDENTMQQALDTYSYFKGQNVGVRGVSTNVANLVNKVNVHSYNGLDPWRDNNVRRALRASMGSKRAWVSEYGDNDGSGMFLAHTIIEDLTHLMVTGWVYWQPLEPYSPWGLVNGLYGNLEHENSATRAQPYAWWPKYHVFAQFTRFLRPGYKVLGSNDANTVVGYDAGRMRLVLVTVNFGQAQRIVYDMSGFGSVAASSAVVTVTNTDGSKLQCCFNVPIAASKLAISAEANSVYSVVVGGVVL